jgi:hypothetical protein
MRRSAAEILLAAREAEVAEPVLRRGAAEWLLRDHMSDLGLEASRVMWLNDPASFPARLSTPRARQANATLYERERTIQRDLQRRLVGAKRRTAWRWEAANLKALRLPAALADVAARAADTSVDAGTRVPFRTWWGVRLLAQLVSCFPEDGLVQAYGLLLRIERLHDAGVWGFGLGDDEVLAIPAPVFRLRRGRLNCESGPAIEWRSGLGRYFWNGIEVPGAVIRNLAGLDPRDLVREPNVRVRRIMLERSDYERLFAALGLEPVSQDGFGKLYRLRFADDEPLTMVEVVNSTPERDGSFKRYMLRVPGRMRTARAAVAWTFGLRAEEYGPCVAS